ncbi:MAG: VOC family protein [Parvularculaceae bacterium]|nr:VOC family protein [Parvularculaceae bacterium]
MKPVIALLFLAGLSAGCARTEVAKPVSNPVAYVEIPVADMDRAVAFYETVFGADFTRETVDGYEMALFPYTEGAGGASAALAKGDVYVPAKTGPIIYLAVDDIDAALTRATARGAPILFEKKNVGHAIIAEIEDSEGNRIALMQR